MQGIIMGTKMIQLHLINWSYKEGERSLHITVISVHLFISCLLRSSLCVGTVHRELNQSDKNLCPPDLTVQKESTG